MVSVLDEKVLGDEPIELREDCKNTLYPLIAGFALLVTHCQSVFATDETQYRRPEESAPAWADRGILRQFRFIHTIPLLDVQPGDGMSILRMLDSILPRMSNANVLDLRNRLEHKREPFPTRSEL